MISGIIRVIIQNSSYQNKNRQEVKNREIRYLSDLSIFNLLSVFVLVRRFLNYYPNYPTHRSYFGEVETPYSIRARGVHKLWRGLGIIAKQSTDKTKNVSVTILLNLFRKHSLESNQHSLEINQHSLQNLFTFVSNEYNCYLVRAK